MSARSGAGFLDRFWAGYHAADMRAGSFGPSQAVSDPAHWILRSLGFKTNSGITVNEFSALNLPVVYACWNRISNPIAMFPANIYKTVNGEGVLDPSHPLNPILKLRPNKFMSARTLKKTAQIHALGWGNGYIEIERNNAGAAVGLWPLLPWHTNKKRIGSELVIDTTIDGRTFRLADDNVLHLMDITLDGYIGESPIRRAAAAVGLARAAEQFGEKFFANDSRAGGFLSHPGKLGDEGKKNVGESFSAQGGLDNAFRVKVLEEGMKFVQTTIPPDDAQFLQTRVFQLGELARIYNVPLFLLQSNEKDTSWGSGLEQMMIAFVVHTLTPWTESWEQEMNWKLFSEEERAAGYYIKFNMNALLRGDMAARAAFYKELIGLSVMKPATAAAKEDLPIIAGADRLFRQQTLVPIETPANGGSDAQAPAP